MRVGGPGEAALVENVIMEKGGSGCGWMDGWITKLNLKHTQNKGKTFLFLWSDLDFYTMKKKIFNTYKPQKKIEFRIYKVCCSIFDYKSSFCKNVIQQASFEESNKTLDL